MRHRALIVSSILTLPLLCFGCSVQQRAHTETALAKALISLTAAPPQPPAPA